MSLQSLKTLGFQLVPSSCLLMLAAGLLVVVSSMPVGAGVVDGRALIRAQDEGHVRVVVKLGRAGKSLRRQSLGTRRSTVAAMRDAVLSGVRKRGVAVRHEYEVVPGFSATVSPAGLAELAEHPDVERIIMDAEGGGALSVSVPQIRADRVHERGITGEGTVVAVLDTGVDTDHPDIADALIHEECFCSGDCCPNGQSRQSGPGSAESRHEHGVHVAGIAVSRGRVAAAGVAPGARLVAVRVLNDQNRGLLSDWIAALDWIAANRHDVRVVNMSLVSDALFEGDCDESDALNQMFADVVNTLYDNGTLVFAAAGNNGRPNLLSSPACISRAMSVSSVTWGDEVFFGGNSGPNLDLLAPGVSIVSDAPGGGLETLSGTSMASPHAAGVAALLLSAYPASPAATIDRVLRETGVPIRDVRNDKVTPRVAALPALVALDEFAEMLRGGGGESSDCLLEWNFIPPSIASAYPRPTAVCSDGDWSCDADQDDGQCTFEVSLCFNMPDPRLPECSPDEPLVWYDASVTAANVCVGDCDGNGAVTVGEIILAVGVALGAEPLESCPVADAEDNGLVEASDLVTIVGNLLDGCRKQKDLNATRFINSLPSFPIAGTRICSVPIPLVVQRPAGGSETGFGTVRMSVQSDSQRDYDRVILVCEAPS